VVASLADGLSAAHGLGILHRDIKPANVLLSAEGTPRLVDFGLVLFIGPQEVTALTRTGTQVGTLQYLPPEAVAGRP